MIPTTNIDDDSRRHQPCHHSQSLVASAFCVYRLIEVMNVEIANIGKESTSEQKEKIQEMLQWCLDVCIPNVGNLLVIDFNE
ncbi:hypothetical protein F0562_022114 [Nyssa sinensis]|uniref:Uncharacterized protein n=1 Tax=Nyssa sinensis TaxID=561372 RepID=A0A5J5BQV6_9ASTE|nr:hypothetical protein F0562_022114 [Nyssa sinensis]